MPIPHVTERMKEAPAVALRTLFAGIGQLLLAADKLRGRALEQLATGRAGRPGEAAPPTKLQPEREDSVRLVHEPVPPNGHAGARPAPAGPAPARPSAAGPSAAQPAAAGKAAAAGPSPAAPPIEGYDDLSLASLRGRLRVLDAGTLRSLIDYEKAHAGREAVISMFERRLAKISGDTGGAG